MQRLVAAGCAILVWITSAGIMSAREYKHPSGFTLQLPDGWQVTRFEHGEVKIANPPQTQFAFVIPILGRTLNCDALLKGTLEGGWAAFPGPTKLVVESVSRGSVIARFLFQERASRGAILCAETGARTGMMYAIGAPAAEFGKAQPVLTAILKSFRYGEAEVAPGAPAGLPPMMAWREPNESAFVVPVPKGWQVQGGIVRASNTDIRGGIRAWSADGANLIQFNDSRIDKVLVPGRQPMPPAPLGRGWRAGPYQSGLQMADWYLRQVWMADLGLSQLEIVNGKDRPDLSAAADQVPAQMGVRGFQHSYGEIAFRALRKGLPVEGRLLGMTRMLWSPNPELMGGNFETEIKGYMGPLGTGEALARIGGHMEVNTRYDAQWIAGNRQAAAADVKLALEQMRASAEVQQKAFWERMAASGRRAEAVNDVLGGRVRLTDGQGNQYEAKAGSNYYFMDEQGAKTARRPDDAVLGTNVYPANVDLRPLEVVR